MNLIQNNKRFEIISRQFTKVRKRSDGEDFVQTFNFKTFSFIWDLPKNNETLYKLFTYFQKLFFDGIVRDDKERKSPSSMPLIFQETMPIGSDLITFAQEANFEKSEKYQHQVVENYLMYNDPKTLAVEIPVWNDEMSGFIDDLRWYKEIEMLYICDFKPGAAKDKKAPTQLFYYRKLLSECAGIPLDKIGATYFDDLTAHELTF